MNLIDDFVNRIMSVLEKVRQTSDLKFTYMLEVRLDVEEWLKSTQYNYTKELDKDFTDIVNITFNDKQGAMEFKLRFINI